MHFSRQNQETQKNQVGFSLSIFPFHIGHEVTKTNDLDIDVVRTD